MDTRRCAQCSNEAAACSSCVQGSFGALVETMRAPIRLPGDHVRFERRDLEGRLHDEFGHPSVTEFDAAGRLRFREHHEHGVPGDVGLAPARLWFFADGRPHLAHRMFAGVLHDHIGDDGRLLPAVVEFGTRGRLIHHELWLNGVPRTD